ncbi:MAG: AAA family ATPase, partial [Lentisphaeraceae bacterium]|nr:AAA family ATPase [Lentisphaeraceae bacterium]
MNSDYTEETHSVDDSSQAMSAGLNKINQIKEEIQKVVVGQPEVVNQILAAFLAAGHVLIEGVP